MRVIAVAATLGCLFGGAALADDQEFSYKKAASVQAIMAYMVKPANGLIKEFREAGGPSAKEEWQEAFSAIAMINEATQLIMMDGRPKDDVWNEGAKKVIAGSRDAMMGAYRMDAGGYGSGLKAMGAGCKTCHDVHKKDKK